MVFSKRVYAKRKRTGSKKRYEKPKKVRVENQEIGFNLYGKVRNTPLPTTLKAECLYATTVSLNVPSLGALVTNVFSANGLFDPDITNVGHQPRGFDELIQLYDHYVVIGSKITVMACAEQATNPLYFGITLRDQAGVASDPDGVLETPFVSYKLCSPNGPAESVVQQFNNKYLGYSSPMNVVDLEGNSASNPNEQAFYHLFAYSPSSTDEAAINVSVRIQYQVVFKEPRVPNKS